MTKEDKLINTIVDLADVHLGGERSQSAKAFFYDLAGEAKRYGFVQLERIAQKVGQHFDYDAH